MFYTLKTAWKKNTSKLLLIVIAIKYYNWCYTVFVVMLKKTIDLRFFFVYF